MSKVLALFGTMEPRTVLSSDMSQGQDAERNNTSDSGFSCSIVEEALAYTDTLENVLLDSLSDRFESRVRLPKAEKQPE